MGFYLKIAARNLIQSKWRGLVLSAALGSVAALLVFLMSLTNGITGNIKASATIIASGHVNVGGFYKTTPSDVAPVVIDTPTIRKIVEENTPGLAYVIDRHRGWAKLVSDTGSGFVGPAGIDPAQEERLKDALSLARESEYVEGGSDKQLGELDRIGEPGSVVLFASQAKKLGIVVGDDVTLTSQSFKGVNNSTSVSVVAIAEDIGMLSMWAAFVNKKTLLDLYQLKDDTTGAVMVYIDDIDESEVVAEHLRKVFADKGFKMMEPAAEPFFAKFEGVMAEDWTGQKLDISTWADEVSFAQYIVTGLDVVTGVLIFVLLIVIGLGITNVMWIAVRERTGEIGTLRAIGMGRTPVLLMFIMEAFVLGLFATGVGTILGALLCLGLDAMGIPLGHEAIRSIFMSNTLTFDVEPMYILATTAGFTLVAMAASLFPSWKASRMQPVTAIQHVN